MAIELGAAYVTVIPEMAGAQREIGKALGDKSMGNKAGQDVGGAMFEGIAGKIKGIAKLIAGMAATKAVIDFGRAALDSYAQYEQLVGGVDTLFGEASGQVQEFAANAFQAAGMSANEYMETVTGFSASLIQSLDGDTVRAAEVADMAIRDMSDNANKMGSDMESIQNAYQGFAKQNYTMLDNLKLGYGGTKEEMERLLRDAEAISGVHYDIDSYSDVVEAIHVIQDNMGIAGATAEEAASTIEGSVGMMRAAWANWVTGIADESADMGELSQNLVNSVLTAAKNVIPRIGQIARGIISSLPSTLSSLVHEAFTSLPDLVRATFGDAAADGLVEFMKPFMGLRLSVQRVIEPVQAAFASMQERIAGHMEDLAPVMDDVKDAVGRFAEALGYLIEQAAPVVAEIAGNLVSGLVGLAPVIGSVITFVTDLASTIMTVLGGAIQFGVWAFTTGIPAAVDFLKAKWDELKAKVSEMAGAVSERFASIKDSVSSKAEAIRSTVKSKFDAVRNAIVQPIERARDAIKAAIDKIKSFFNVKLKFPDIKLPHFRISGGKAPWGLGGAGTAPSIGIDWYAKGGFVDGATLIGVGEQGAEMVWPSYEPYLTKYASAIAEHMGGASTVNNYYIDGNLVAADAALAAALDTVAQRVGGMRRMGVA